MREAGTLLEGVKRNFAEVAEGLPRLPPEVRRSQMAWLNRGVAEIRALEARMMPQRNGLGFLPLLWVGGAALVAGGGAWLGSQVQKWFDDSERQKQKQQCFDAMRAEGKSAEEAAKLCYSGDGIPSWVWVVLAASVVFTVGWIATRRK